MFGILGDIIMDEAKQNVINYGLNTVGINMGRGTKHK